jgi:hypothetical protein
MAVKSEPKRTRRRRTPAEIYRSHFHGARRERMFLASLSFFVCFFIVRLITHAIRAGRGPFHNVETGGFHLHHMVWGISLLLVIGYLWLMQIATGVGESSSPWGSRITAIVFGIGSALTLDEFALWLRLEDVYWTHEGRESVDAVILFGALLSAGLWGRPFLHEVAKEALRALRLIE